MPNETESVGDRIIVNRDEAEKLISEFKDLCFRVGNFELNSGGVTKFAFLGMPSILHSTQSAK